MNVANQIKRNILYLIDDIDVRLEFGLKPLKIRVPRRFRFKSEVVYDSLKKKMYDFSGMAEQPPYWIIREDINFEYFRTPNVYVFNMGWQDYDMTLVSETETIGPTKCSNHIVRNSVKFI